MALRRDVTYSGRFTPATTERPQGGFKNRTSPTSEDGSYLEEQWLNDLDGFFGSLLNATNTTPNGNVDEAGNSQLFDAATQLFSQEWSENVNYSIGHEVARNNLRYIARAASGPDNGGAITPENNSGSTWDLVLPQAYSTTDTQTDWLRLALVVGDNNGAGDFLSLEVIGGSDFGVNTRFSADIMITERAGSAQVIVTPKTLGLTNPEFYIKSPSANTYELWMKRLTDLSSPVTVVRKSRSRYSATVAGILSITNTAPSGVTLVPYDTGYQFASIPIGMEVTFDTPPPTNDPRFRFVKLTYNDAYNTGLLTSQTLSGSAPELVSTAVISAAQSPINGQTIYLKNTMGVYAVPAVTQGIVAQNIPQPARYRIDSISPGVSLQTGPSISGFIISSASQEAQITGGLKPRSFGEVVYKRVY
ncbi:putative tail-fiber protein [Vibrio phage vB_VchM-138]|uniref:tail fiber protein n=1 Tax=Vibrio phage vB_VchM-138 TaxID=1127518 RepID=UPI0002536E2B|nr:tail fiber protein [Vibrio phage vB_VchM-138]AFC22741.1 putative tail-fiber protein [Vibrio phage vB_VchM-138]